MTAERPRFHFTPPRNFMNDPNGLVYWDGEYHLFYQHNPHASVWGHMCWGHAVSRDLIRWEHLPLALPEGDGLMMFSGSAVVDRDDTSGFAAAGQPALVLIHTAHEVATGRQTQALAYSTDRGRTFSRYAGNPVIDEGREQFRDPKVLWYEPGDCWVMVVSLGSDRRVRFYRSADLKAWEATGEFGPAGATGVPNWECPDLFPLPVEGSDEVRWVLKVDVGGGAPAGGSGSQYFVGRFDGRRFLCDDGPARTRWTDWGADFYAAQSWSGLPRGAVRRPGQRIWLGWMSNWRYALVTPTAPWRGMMTLPREVGLRRVRGDLVLVQRPIAELARALREADRAPDASGAPHGVRLELSRSAGQLGIAIGRPGDECLCGADFARGELFFDRRGLRAARFHDAFAGRHTAPLPAEVETLTLEIVLDRHSVECFAVDGEVVLSELVFFDGAPGIRALGAA